MIWLTTIIVAQSCSSLSPNARVICNQQHELKEATKDIAKKVDQIVAVQQEALRTADRHEYRLTKAEDDSKVMRINIDTLLTWRSELMGKLGLVAAAIALAVPFCTSWLNRRWAKRDKARGEA